MNLVTQGFIVSPMWRVLLSDMGLDETLVLKMARLPVNLFTLEKAKIASEDYFRLLSVLDQLLNEPFPLKMAELFSTEAFDAPIFAALCCDNLIHAVERLKVYKPLISPMRLRIKQENCFTVTVDFW